MAIIIILLLVYFRCSIGRIYFKQSGYHYVFLYHIIIVYYTGLIYLNKDILILLLYLYYHCITCSFKSMFVFLTNEYLVRLYYAVMLQYIMYVFYLLIMAVSSLFDFPSAPNLTKWVIKHWCDYYLKLNLVDEQKKKGK